MAVKKVGIGVLLLGGLALWAWSKAKKVEAEPAVPTISVTPAVTLLEQYIAAGYSESVAKNIVAAIQAYESEMARIQAQTSAVTAGEIQGGLGLTQAATTQALAEMATKPAEYAPFTPEQVAAYKSEPAKNIYSIECTTQACALESAERQYYIASIQTDPAIRASMMLIAEGMFTQAAQMAPAPTAPIMVAPAVVTAPAIAPAPPPPPPVAAPPAPIEQAVAQGTVPEGFTASSAQLDTVVAAGYNVGSPVYSAAVDLAYTEVASSLTPDQVVAWSPTQGYYAIAVEETYAWAYE